ncbi:MAG: hypothetical protein HQL42_16095 [Alphaproteobacteria bacterium]|nr:hypothetical protein [Alphaproteobacteria bacterium]
MAAGPVGGVILGLHATGDCTGAALFRDGKLVGAVLEERLNRAKRTRSFPHQSIAWCLREAGLSSLDDVDTVTVAWNPAIPMSAINMSGFTNWRRYDPEFLYIVPNHLMGSMTGWDDSATTLGLGLQGDPRFVFVKHHLAHMGWAAASPFEQAALAVFDEHGEAKSSSFGTITGNRIEVSHDISASHSLGTLYGTFTQYLGFRPYSEEWKVMGAAAYGDPARFTPRLLEIVRCDDTGFRLDQNYFEFMNMRFAGYYGEALVQHLGIAPRAAGAPFEQCHFDLAAAVQTVFESIAFTLLRRLNSLTGLRSLVLTGGCAMNSLANGRIVANTPFDQVYIPQAPGDPGGCIGGPLWLLSQRAEDSLFRADIPACTGPDIDDEAVLATLTRCKIAYRRVDDPAAAAADLMATGHIIGWVQGRLEFGDRALGNRSILADPRRAEMKDRINASVKYRELFRPLAPAVLAEAAGTYFDHPPGLVVRHMERVLQARPRAAEQIPAVIHADGTGRVQMVTRQDNPLFHRLIESFRERTGVPVVLNTSFNVNGEPIVATAEDAIRTFFSSGIDALVIGSFVVEKTPGVTGGAW